MIKMVKVSNTFIYLSGVLVTALNLLKKPESKDIETISLNFNNYFKENKIWGTDDFTSSKKEKETFYEPLHYSHIVNLFNQKKRSNIKTSARHLLYSSSQNIPEDPYAPTKKSKKYSLLLTTESSSNDNDFLPRSLPEESFIKEKAVNVLSDVDNAVVKKKKTKIKKKHKSSIINLSSWGPNPQGKIKENPPIRVLRLHEIDFNKLLKNLLKNKNKAKHIDKNKEKGNIPDSEINAKKHSGEANNSNKHHQSKLGINLDQRILIDNYRNKTIKYSHLLKMPNVIKSHNNQSRNRTNNQENEKFTMATEKNLKESAGTSGKEDFELTYSLNNNLSNKTFAESGFKIPLLTKSEHVNPAKNSSEFDQIDAELIIKYEGDSRHEDNLKPRAKFLDKKHKSNSTNQKSNGKFNLKREQTENTKFNHNRRKAHTLNLEGKEIISSTDFKKGNGNKNKERNRKHVNQKHISFNEIQVKKINNKSGDIMKLNHDTLELKKKPFIKETDDNKIHSNGKANTINNMIKAIINSTKDSSDDLEESNGFVKEVDSYIQQPYHEASENDSKTVKNKTMDDMNRSNLFSITQKKTSLKLFDDTKPKLSNLILDKPHSSDSLKGKNGVTVNGIDSDKKTFTGQKLGKIQEKVKIDGKEKPKLLKSSLKPDLNLHKNENLTSEQKSGAYSNITDSLQQLDNWQKFGTISSKAQLSGINILTRKSLASPPLNEHLEKFKEKTNFDDGFFEGVAKAIQRIKLRQGMKSSSISAERLGETDGIELTYHHNDNEKLDKNTPNSQKLAARRTLENLPLKINALNSNNTDSKTANDAKTSMLPFLYPKAELNPKPFVDSNSNGVNNSTLLTGNFSNSDNNIKTSNTLRNDDNKFKSQTEFASRPEDKSTSTNKEGLSTTAKFNKNKNNTTSLFKFYNTVENKSTSVSGNPNDMLNNSTSLSVIANKDEKNITSSSTYSNNMENTADSLSGVTSINLRNISLLSGITYENISNETNTFDSSDRRRDFQLSPVVFRSDEQQNSTILPASFTSGKVKSKTSGDYNSNNTQGPVIKSVVISKNLETVTRNSAISKEINGSNLNYEESGEHSSAFFSNNTDNKISDIKGEDDPAKISNLGKISNENIEGAFRARQQKEEFLKTKKSEIFDQDKILHPKVFKKSTLYSIAALNELEHSPEQYKKPEDPMAQLYIDVQGLDSTEKNAVKGFLKGEERQAEEFNMKNKLNEGFTHAGVSSEENFKTITPYENADDNYADSQINALKRIQQRQRQHLLMFMLQKKARTKKMERLKKLEDRLYTLRRLETSRKKQMSNPTISYYSTTSSAMNNKYEELYDKILRSNGMNSEGVQKGEAFTRPDMHDYYLAPEINQKIQSESDSTVRYDRTTSKSGTSKLKSLFHQLGNDTPSTFYTNFNNITIPKIHQIHLSIHPPRGYHHKKAKSVVDSQDAVTASKRQMHEIIFRPHIDSEINSNVKIVHEPIPEDMQKTFSNMLIQLPTPLPLRRSRNPTTTATTMVTKRRHTTAQLLLYTHATGYEMTTQPGALKEEYYIQPNKTNGDAGFWLENENLKLKNNNVKANTNNFIDGGFFLENKPYKPLPLSDSIKVPIKKLESSKPKKVSTEWPLNTNNQTIKSRNDYEKHYVNYINKPDVVERVEEVEVDKEPVVKISKNTSNASTDIKPLNNSIENLKSKPKSITHVEYEKNHAKFKAYDYETSFENKITGDSKEYLVSNEHHLRPDEKGIINLGKLVGSDHNNSSANKQEHFSKISTDAPASDNQYTSIRTPPSDSSDSNIPAVSLPEFFHDHPTIGALSITAGKRGIQSVSSYTLQEMEEDKLHEIKPLNDTKVTQGKEKFMSENEDRDRFETTTSLEDDSAKNIAPFVKTDDSLSIPVEEFLKRNDLHSSMHELPPSFFNENIDYINNHDQFRSSDNNPTERINSSTDNLKSFKDSNNQVINVYHLNVNDNSIGSINKSSESLVPEEIYPTVSTVAVSPKFITATIPKKLNFTNEQENGQILSILSPTDITRVMFPSMKPFMMGRMRMRMRERNQEVTKPPSINVRPPVMPVTKLPRPTIDQPNRQPYYPSSKPSENVVFAFPISKEKSALGRGFSSSLDKVNMSAIESDLPYRQLSAVVNPVMLQTTQTAIVSNLRLSPSSLVSHNLTDVASQTNNLVNSLDNYKVVSKPQSISKLSVGNDPESSHAPDIYTQMNLDDMYWTDSTEEIENACKQQKATNKVVNILAFGDSLTRGYYNKGKNHHPYTMKLQYLLNKLDEKKCFIVDNEGRDGEIAFGEMPKRMEDIFTLSRKKFDWVIILGGTNDIYNKKHAGRHTAKELTQNILSIHNIARHHNARTVVVTIPEVFCESKLCSDMKQIRETLNENLRSYAFDHKDDVILCDLADILGRYKNNQKLMAQFFEGGLHLKPRGYETMARLLFESLKPILD